MILCIYRGDYSGRVGYIWFMFILGTVGIARLSIEQSRKYALGYMAALGAATFIVLSRFITVQGSLSAITPIVNGAMIALVWILADRITFDCTLIDEDQDASDRGLLDGLSQSESSALRDSKQHATRRRAHQPGRTVLWLTAAALPVFGFGQAMLPQDERWQRSAIMALAVYLFATLSLLVATSFLGVRRYLRQRGVDMPANVSLAWLVGGVVMTMVMLLLCFLLPQPGKMLATVQLPSSLDSPDWLKPSKYGWGNETVKPDASNPSAATAPTPPESEPAENGEPGDSSGKGNSPGGSSGANQDSGSSGQQNDASGSEGKSGKGGKANEGTSTSQPGRSAEQTPSTSTAEKSQEQTESSNGNGDQGKDNSNANRNSNRGEDPKQGDSAPKTDGTKPNEKQPGDKQPGDKSSSDESPREPGKQDASPSTTPKDDESREESSEQSQTPQEPKANDSDDQENPSRESKDEPSKSGGEQKQEEPKEANESKSQSPPESPETPESSDGPSFLDQWLPSITSLLRFLIYAVLIGVLAVFAWFQRHEIASLVNAFLAWLRGESSPLDDVDVAESQFAESATKRPFSAFRNPLKARSEPREAIIETYQAAEAWWREHGQPRQSHETPHEYVRRLKPKNRAEHEAIVRLTDAYNRVVYGNEIPKPPDLVTAAAVWKSFDQ